MVGGDDVPASPPFTATLSNTTPLVFGMEAEDAARAAMKAWMTREGIPFPPL